MSESDEPAPGPHPPPPTDLPSRTLPIVEYRGPWRRLCRADRDPVHFGASGGGRFDAPDGSYGVLYIAEDAHGAFIETFGRQTGIAYIVRSELRLRSLGVIEATRSLRLVDLTGHGLARLSADGRLTTGAHATSQTWAAALSTHQDAPDGVLYRARHDPSRLCAAVFNRVAEHIRWASLGTLADPRHSALLADILTTYAFGLVEDEP